MGKENSIKREFLMLEKISIKTTTSSAFEIYVDRYLEPMNTFIIHCER